MSSCPVSEEAAWAESRESKRNKVDLLSVQKPDFFCFSDKTQSQTKPICIHAHLKCIHLGLTRGSQTPKAPENRQIPLTEQFGSSSRQAVKTTYEKVWSLQKRTKTTSGTPERTIEILVEKVFWPRPPTRPQLRLGVLRLLQSTWQLRSKGSRTPLLPRPYSFGTMGYCLLIVGMPGTFIDAMDTA
ncbi:hypothetical protein CROQUDRAFT_103799 [Cronartium quercuum f. sp. fusiforme G11]|uniref:Uncharacterized protein n=1 Tax=Cronartium quercuum f. sp. fusiforme G11 TaxID=708437 RepID=A0A9P6TGY5_9BASI|nr:hypothetical protein CROQUDRAFT_103799 [Cronartium quercuum f. sp. fusiforme G11]